MTHALANPLGFLVFLTTYLTVVNAGYILTTPKVIHGGSTTKLCIKLYNITEDGTLTAKLLQFSNASVVIAEKEYEIKNGESQCLDFNVPDYSGSEAKLQVIGDFPGENNSFNSSKDINYKPSKKIILVQPDKAVYKPGQTVKFRLASFTSELIPITDVQGDIWIEDPNGIRVIQKLKASFEKGLIQYEFKLSEEPPLGDWTIFAELPYRKEQKSFEVAEYVLPKFEVTVTPPPYVLSDAEEIVYTICAKYTYGQPVQGELNLTVSYERYPWEKYTEYPSVHREVPIDGCYEFVFNSTKIRFHEDFLHYRRIELFAQVNETGTGLVRNATSFITKEFNPLSLSFQDNDHGKNYFKSNLPFFGSLKVTNPDDTPVEGEVIQLCLLSQAERVRPHLWRTDKCLSCKNYTSNAEGIIRFTIPPQKDDVLSLSVEATAVNRPTKKYKDYRNKINQPKSTLSLQAFYSPSKSFLQVEPSRDVLKCHVTYPVTVRYTAKKSEKFNITYQVIARGRIIKEEMIEEVFRDENTEQLQKDDSYLSEPGLEQSEVLDGKPLCGEKLTESDTSISSFTINLEPGFELMPVVRVLVFYVRDDGEVVADTAEFEVESCLRNNVSLKFASQKIQPGIATGITLEASPRSYCGIGVVDRSVELFKKTGDFNKQKINEILKTMDVDRYTWPTQESSDHCRKSAPISPYYSYPRYPTTDYVDSITAFDESGVLVMSDLKVETRPCRKEEFDRPPYGVAFSQPARPALGGFRPPAPPSTTRPFNKVGVAGAVEASQVQDAAGFGGSSAAGRIPPKSAVSVRNYFPETWLWDLVDVDDQGSFSYKKETPHTVTEWIGRAICINKDTGVGVSDPVTLTTFQPFFVSLTLPYSVVRGETLPVIVKVFNYLDKCLRIKLALAESEHFERVDGSSSPSLCVCGGKGETSRFNITGKSLGEVNLTVTARTSPDDSVCGEKEVEDVNAADAVTKQIIIKAEGFPKEQTISHLVCPKDLQDGKGHHELDLQLPEDVVPDSPRAYFRISGDVMGPALENLDSLVIIPTGCGEQNMVKFTPMISLLKYLQSTGKLKEDLRSKIIGYMNTGYQRELTFRHSDGSYSAFGNHDREGSIFLTAFVVSSFAKAADDIFIDRKDLETSINWILSKQEKNGCFPNVGTLLSHGIRGVVNETAKGPLTSYILISLLEANSVLPNVTEAALQCINAEKNPKPHSLALAAYAAALANHSSAQTYLEKLEEAAKSKDGLQYWSNDEQHPSLSADIETASYVILSYLALGSEENFAKAQPIVRWLSTKRNSRGGFYSTQDTVMGLQALSSFAVHLSKEPVSITSLLKGDSVDKSFDLNEEDKLVVQTLKVEKLPNKLVAETTGTGCALLSATLKYNTQSSPEDKGFDLTAEPTPGCKAASVKLCVKYTGGEQNSSMAVLEVGYQSGWAVVEDSMQPIYRQGVALKRHEVEKDHTNLYFDEFTKEERCFSLRFEQESVIEDAKPSTIKVYDYYVQENSKSISYTIGSNC